MSIFKFIQIIVALTWLFLSAHSGAETMTQRGAYNGKDGPASLRDIYWYGPPRTGDMCWYERDTKGAVIKSRCGSLEPRYCSGMGIPIQVCDPISHELCMLNENTSTALISGEVCTKYNPSITYQVDISAAIGGATTAPAWEKLPGAAIDISVGANGHLWVIGTAAAGVGGNEIYRMENGNWVRIPGAAERIAVDGAGNAWVTTKNYEIYRWNGNGWTRLPGAGREIAVDVNGRAWVLGTKAINGGYEVYRWSNSNNWELMSENLYNLFYASGLKGVTGGLMKISVSTNRFGSTIEGGAAVGINRQDHVFQDVYSWYPQIKAWGMDIYNHIQNGAIDVAASESGSIFKVGRDGYVYKTEWNNRSRDDRTGEASAFWSRIDSRNLPAFKEISVDKNDVIYVIAENGAIYRRRPQ